MYITDNSHPKPKELILLSTRQRSLDSVTSSLRLPFFFDNFGYLNILDVQSNFYEGDMKVTLYHVNLLDLHKLITPQELGKILVAYITSGIFSKSRLEDTIWEAKDKYPNNYIIKLLEYAYDNFGVNHAILLLDGINGITKREIHIKPHLGRTVHLLNGPHDFLHLYPVYKFLWVLCVNGGFNLVSNVITYSSFEMTGQIKITEEDLWWGN